VPIIDHPEVDEGRFWSRPEIEHNIDTGVVTPNFEYEYNHVLKNAGY